MTTAGGPQALSRGLLYSQCWEDSDVARSALRIGPGSTVLAIAAAGDNVVALLQDDPARVIAIDVNPAQTALVDLKMSAIRYLGDAGRVAAFLGVAPSGERTGGRTDVYDTLRATLAAGTRSHWDASSSAIDRGVIHAGRFERYVAAFRRAVLPLVPGGPVVRDMLRAPTLADQRRIYRERWDSRRWRVLFRLFFSRALLRRFGRDPAFFTQCEISNIGEHYLARAEHALAHVPISSNPYLTYLLSGRVGTGARAPDYLRPAVQQRVRDRLGRVALHTASLDDVLRDLPARSVDAFYLSDVFELSTPAAHAATLSEVARVGRPGARICYWNNLVGRRRPDRLAGEIESHEDEAADLYLRDRAFLYARFVVESVRGAA